MKTIHPQHEDFPIPLERFVEFIRDLSESVTLDDIPLNGVLCREHIVADYGKKNQENGFSVRLEFTKNNKKEIDMFVQEVIFYDDMDEWLDALNRINKMKLKNSMDASE